MTTLVLGPSLGTSADACWGPTAALLRDELDVLAWELPGHGTDRGPVPPDLTVEQLAVRVLDMVEGPFLYAGDSVGGEVGLELLLTAPDRVLGAVLCCTGARIGTREGWQQRIAAVRASGTASLVTETPPRWFGPDFMAQHPDRASALLHALRDASDDGYVAVCGALAAYDARDRLAGITAPVVAVAGAHDPTCPPDSLRELAEGVRSGRLVVLDDVCHQAPAEAPEQVAELIRRLTEDVTGGRL